MTHAEQSTIQTSNTNQVLRGLMVGFALFFFNLIFILGPYIGIWGVIIGLLASGFAAVAAGGAILVSMLVALPISMTLPAVMIAHPPVLIFISLLVIGIGSLLSTLLLWIAKITCSLTYRYLLWNLRMIRGESYEA